MSANCLFSSMFTCYQHRGVCCLLKGKEAEARSEDNKSGLVTAVIMHRII